MFLVGAIRTATEGQSSRAKHVEKFSRSPAAVPVPLSTMLPPGTLSAAFVLLSFANLEILNDVRIL